MAGSGGTLCISGGMIGAKADRSGMMNFLFVSVFLDSSRASASQPAPSSMDLERRALSVSLARHNGSRANPDQLSRRCFV